MVMSERIHPTVSFQNRSERALTVEMATVFMLVFCYAGWFVSGYSLMPGHPLLGGLALALFIALHSSLQHEATHGHPTSSSWLNEVLVGLPLGVFYPFRRYKETHLQHHREEWLTDPGEDPESYYCSPEKWANLPTWQKRILEANNTFLGRVALGPAIGFIRFVSADGREILRGNREILLAWVIHLMSIGILWSVVSRIFGLPFWLYVIVPAYIGNSLIAVRSYCEHQWDENTSRRTIIVESSFLSWVFLHNNLHFVHHKRPDLPWYRLPQVYRADRSSWREGNGQYVFPNYRMIAWRYLMRRKEEVPHPRQETTSC